MYTEQRQDIIEGQLATTFEPVELRAVSHREDTINNLGWPEDASPHLIATMQYARKASALKSEVDSTSSAINTGIFDKIRQEEQTVNGYQQHLAERFILVNRLGKAIERAGLTLDMTLSEMRKARSYIDRAQTKLGQAQQEAIAAENKQDDLAVHLTNVWDADRRMTNELGRIRNEQREAQLRERFKNADPEVAELRIQEALNSNPNTSDIIKIINGMDSETRARYDELYNRRQVSRKEVEKFDGQHGAATAEVAFKHEAIKQAEALLAAAHSDYETVASLRGPQEERLTMLKKILDFFTEDTRKVVEHFDETDTIEPLEHDLLLRLTSFLEDTTIDRSAESNKMVKYYEMRRDAIRARTMPDGEAAEHLKPIIDSLQAVDTVTANLAEVKNVLTKVYGAIIQGLKSRHLTARDELSQMSSDLAETIQALVAVGHSQDAIDINVTLKDQKKTESESIIELRSQRIAELNTKAGQIITIRGFGTTRLESLNTLMSELTERAEVEHEARETERLRIVHAEVELSPEERKAWIEHDLGQADTLRGYDPNHAWSHPERLPFRGVDKYLLPPEVFASYQDAVAERVDVQNKLDMLTHAHTQLLNETRSLENERRQLRASTDHTAAELQDLAERTHHHMQAVSELRSRLVLAENHFDEVREAYKPYIQEHKSALVPATPSSVVVQQPPTPVRELSQETAIVLRGTKPDVIDPPQQLPRAADLEGQFINERSGGKVRKLLGRLAT